MGVTGSSTAELARLVDEVIKGGKGFQEDNVSKIAQEMAKLFSVKQDEVAILVVSHEGTLLEFLYPFKLQKIGSIPMSIANSLAVRTIRDKRPEMINNFTAQKHPTVFESVSLEPGAQEKHPIQKIMSAPLLVDGKPVGAVQISRKGKTPTTAGADFTIRDLTTLMTTSGLLAKCFRK
ncbi:MAG: GAF domain-containing protein [Acidobacteria bacterium]|nr:GAF domain-containing protein [Acidobacteriota bacterium]